MTESVQPMPSEVESAGIAEELGIDWLEVPFDLDEFRAGLHVELRRSAAAGEEPDALGCGRLVMSRLVEQRDYYRALAPWGPDGEHAPPP